MRYRPRINLFAKVIPKRMSWKRLIRFEDEFGKERFGEPNIDNAAELFASLRNGNLSANVFSGEDTFALYSTREIVKVGRLLPVLTREDVPLVKCIGLNCKLPSFPVSCIPTPLCTKAL
jgi:hypothetical protein